MTIQTEVVTTDSPWRPVQFLGNKLRSLSPIAEAVTSLKEGSQRIWEPFAGSTVVSQRLASDGHTLWSCDALSSSSAFAASILGVQRPSSDESLNLIVNKVIEFAEAIDTSLWGTSLKKERSALVEGDGARLLEFEAQLPQRWRPNEATPRMQEHFDIVTARAQEGAECWHGLISTVYAGSYFSLEQSLHLERLRGGIAAVTEGQTTLWEYNVLITALCYAASRAVYSPGKHFAQPHRIRPDKNLAFHAKRALQDRSVNVLNAFAEGVAQVVAVARPGLERHRAERRLCDTVSAADLYAWEVDTVYADPPYTAQQYSRFYHLLETLMSGIPPRLQERAGQVTRGLYPANRYHSPFSSRRQAPDAFQSLITTTHAAGANLLLSYSAGLGGATGNARMVTLDDLTTWMHNVYGSSQVTVERLSLKYRQFNNGSRAVSERDDPEFLVVGRHSAR